MKRRYFLIIVVIVMLLLPLLAHFRKTNILKHGSNPAGWVIETVPIPKNVEGSFLLNACLSHDESILVVTGRRSMTAKQFAKHFITETGEIEKNDVEFERLTSQFIYTCVWPPNHPDEYQFVAEHPGFSQIVACAISPDKKKIAYLSHEFSWNNTERYKMFPILNKTATYNREASNDILYIVPTEGGLPIALAVLHSYTEIRAGNIHPFAISWSDDADAIYCYDSNTIYRVGIDGEMVQIKQFPKSIVISNFICSKNKLQFVTFQTGTPYGGKTSFISMDVKGTILGNVELENTMIPLSASNCSPAIIGKKSVMFYSSAVTPAFFKVSMDTMKTAMSNVYYEEDDLNFSYALCQYFNNDNDFLVVKYADTTATSVEDRDFLGNKHVISIVKQLEDRKLPMCRLLKVTQNEGH
jgi:hypothetical protein